MTRQRNNDVRLFHVIAHLVFLVFSFVIQMYCACAYSYCTSVKQAIPVIVLKIGDQVPVLRFLKKKVVLRTLPCKILLPRILPEGECYPSSLKIVSIIVIFLTYYPDHSVCLFLSAIRFCKLSRPFLAPVSKC